MSTRGMRVALRTEKRARPVHHLEGEVGCRIRRVENVYIRQVRLRIISVALRFVESLLGLFIFLC
jgi:hypothetical protein